jgi:hypothetical protein
LGGYTALGGAASWRFVEALLLVACGGLCLHVAMNSAVKTLETPLSEAAKTLETPLKAAAREHAQQLGPPLKEAAKELGSAILIAPLAPVAVWALVDLMHRRRR